MSVNSSFRKPCSIENVLSPVFFFFQIRDALLANARYVLQIDNINLAIEDFKIK